MQCRRGLEAKDTGACTPVTRVRIPPPAPNQAGGYFTNLDSEGQGDFGRIFGPVHNPGTQDSEFLHSPRLSLDFVRESDDPLVQATA